MAPPRWLLEHGEFNLHALGPGSELEAEWAVAGLRLPDRSAIRRYRLERVRAQLRTAGCDAALREITEPGGAHLPALRQGSPRPRGGRAPEGPLRRPARLSGQAWDGPACGSGVNRSTFV